MPDVHSCTCAAADQSSDYITFQMPDFRNAWEAELKQANCKLRHFSFPMVMLCLCTQCRALFCHLDLCDAASEQKHPLAVSNICAWIMQWGGGLHAVYPAFLPPETKKPSTPGCEEVYSCVSSRCNPRHTFNVSPQAHVCGCVWLCAHARVQELL